MTDDRYEYDLLATIEEVHMRITGASDVLTDDELARSVDRIRRRVENWQPATISQRYDDAVRALCEAVLAEVDG